MPDNPIKITPEMVLDAYANGYFPMARTKTAKTFEWFLPYDRGILDIDHFHLSKSLRKFINKTDLTLCINQDFPAVIEECSKTHKGRDETWINAEIKSLYKQLHKMGYAHSIETRTPEGELVGGLYGLSLGTAFFGESMFSRRTNASKLALTGLVAYMWKYDFDLLDIQFPNDHFEQFGYEVISNKAYQKRLKHALLKPTGFYPPASLIKNQNYSSDAGVDTESSPEPASDSTLIGESSSISLDDVVAEFLQSRTQIS